MSLICICIKKKSDDSRQESVGRIIKIVGIPPGELIAKTNTLIGFQSFERKKNSFIYTSLKSNQFGLAGCIRENKKEICGKERWPEFFLCKYFYLRL